ncbi:DUF3040 domain-containing protein [Actinomycetospora sp. TBRC 11914]|uniref:DUF3040 domain-containing protein n=1 Tax=Actinomycetospora sp. TBRC 11914 TaxID=2729387 RepID=UPI00145DE31F|nr:DUF3040 domain-containing protein [Actinomycetospora sp. TBRC 11914]NMO93750.1 DUF3040 domain-containing protein [Actinomycetospora sp. TBRC 11914]
MPLDDEERSVLDETERSLAEHDPGLARRLRDGWRHERRRRRGVLVTVSALVLFVGLLWLDLPWQAFLIAALAVAVVVVADWWPVREIGAVLRDHDRKGLR